MPQDGVRDCEHSDWVPLPAWPGTMTCVDCGVWRDLLPQHHLYRMRMPLRGNHSGPVLKIDGHIVELVARAWADGWETTGSCEGGCYDRWLATIELRRGVLRAVTEGSSLQEMYADLQGLRVQANGDLWTVSWEPSWRCPAYDREREIVEESGGHTTRRVIR